MARSHTPRTFALGGALLLAGVPRVSAAPPPSVAWVGAPDIGPLTALAIGPRADVSVCVGDADGRVACTSDAGAVWRIESLDETEPGWGGRNVPAPGRVIETFGGLAGDATVSADEVFGFHAVERGFDPPGGTPTGELRGVFGGLQGASGLELETASGRPVHGARPGADRTALGVRGLAWGEAGRVVFTADTVYAAPDVATPLLSVPGVPSGAVVLGAVWLDAKSGADTLAVVTDAGMLLGDRGGLRAAPALDAALGPPAGGASPLAALEGGGLAVLGARGLARLDGSNRLAALPFPGQVVAAAGRVVLLFDSAGDVALRSADAGTTFAPVPAPPAVPRGAGALGFVAADGPNLWSSADGLAWRRLLELPDGAPIVDAQPAPGGAWVATEDGLWRVDTTRSGAGRGAGSSLQPGSSLAEALESAERFAALRNTDVPSPHTAAGLLPQVDASARWATTDLAARQRFLLDALPPGALANARVAGPLRPFDYAVLANWDLARLFGEPGAEADITRRRLGAAAALRSRVTRLFRARARLSNAALPTTDTPYARAARALDLDRVTDELDFLTGGLFGRAAP